jgi:hypothetical protein
METSQKSPAFPVCVAAYLFRLTDATTWLRQQADVLGRLSLSHWRVEQEGSR